MVANNDGFQKVVRNQPGVAVQGDFYGTNPRASVLGLEGQYQSPLGGVVVGNFAWALPNANALSASYVTPAQIGFVGRNNQALITEFLGIATLTVPRGYPVTLYSQGDFWALFAAGATPGQRVYADPNTGAPVAGPASGINVASVTAVGGFVGTAAQTAAGTTMTVSAVTAGRLIVGSVLAGTGVDVGLTVVAQLTGTPGGVGTYTVSTTTGFASTAVTATSDTMDVTAVGSGVLGVGSKLSGSGVTAGTVITGQLSGTTGGVGVYTISPVQKWTSTTVSENAIPTPFIVNGVAAAGELAPISSWG